MKIRGSPPNKRSIDLFSRKVLSALADLAKTKPQLILDITFPAFLAELPDSETTEKRDASMKKRKGYKTILAAFAQISSEREIFQVLLRRLFSKLDIVLSSMFSYFIADRRYFVYYVSACYSWNGISCNTEKVTIFRCGFTVLYRDTGTDVIE